MDASSHGPVKRTIQPKPKLIMSFVRVIGSSTIQTATCKQ